MPVVMGIKPAQSFLFGLWFRVERGRCGGYCLVVDISDSDSINGSGEADRERCVFTVVANSLLKEITHFLVSEAMHTLYQRAFQWVAREKND
jgi:hypothetical protein